MERLSCIVLLLCSLLTLVNGQQYAGDAINNSLPLTPGSELVFFRIKDPQGKNNNLTLVNYQSLQQNGSRLDPTQLQRAVIVVHGLGQDPATYMSTSLSALSQQLDDPNVNFSSVAIMTPFFANGDNKNVGYPFSTTLGSTSNCLVWKGSQWSAGGDTQYPKSSTGVSSFEVLDQLVKYWDDKTKFPNIKHIVVAGHSLGGQAIARYTQIGKQISTTSRVTYWIGNPNSYTWLDTSRPITSEIDGCPGYDLYRDGYTNFTAYPMTYATALVASGRQAIIDNMNSKSKIYVRGTQDYGDDSSNCNPTTIGLNRNERFFNFIKAWPPSCESVTGHCDMVDYVNFGHDAGAIFASPAGRARLFTDNFYGDGKTAPDFGYPRRQAGDDPYPDTALANPDQPYNDTNTYAGGMTYSGCWTDSFRDIRAFTFLAYDNANNSISQCTKTCAGLGYKSAATEYGSQCFCGDSISAYSTQTVDQGCSMRCPGDVNATCGASYRMSVYSTGSLKQNPVPRTPSRIGDYSYFQCIVESPSGRMLGEKGYGDDKNMTLDSCAAFCQGYKYFGTQYASQCFCGNNFTAPLNVTSASDCYIPCTGTSSELCGGNNRLSVYSLNVISNKSSASSSTTTISTLAGSGSSTASRIVTTLTTSVTTTQTPAQATSTSLEPSSSSSSPSISTTSLVFGTTTSTAIQSQTSSGSSTQLSATSETSSQTGIGSASSSERKESTALDLSSATFESTPITTTSASLGISTTSLLSIVLSSLTQTTTTTLQTPSLSSMTTSNLGSVSRASGTTKITPSASIPSTLTTTRQITSSARLQTLSTKVSSTSAAKTTQALTWKETCPVACFAKSCAGYRTQILSYCATQVTSRSTTTTVVVPRTITATTTNQAKVATLFKTRSTSSARTTAPNTKITCTKAPTALAGYNCAQVTSICNCQMLSTKAVTVTKVVTTSTLVKYPKATRTVTITVG